MADKSRTIAEKQKRQRVKEEFDLITSYLNILEEELMKNNEDSPPDLKKIAIIVGKSIITFTHIASDLEIYERAGK